LLPAASGARHLQCMLAAHSERGEGCMSARASGNSGDGVAAAIEQFGAAIAAAGLSVPEEIKADGRLHRFAPNGKPSDDAGWYVLHPDGVPAGAFGDWRSGESQNWRADIGRRLSPQEEAAHRARVTAMQRERETEEAQRHEAAAKRGAEIWNAATPADAAHPYLKRKGVQPHGLRVHRGPFNGDNRYDGALLVPMREGANLRSLQAIPVAADLKKQFLNGGKVRGAYYSIGKPKVTGRASAIVIAEGFATAASIHEATGLACAAAFSAGNLLSVAQAARERFPDNLIVIAADDDFKTEGNPGITKAREAAQAVGGLVAVPDFGKDRPEGATDFNDLHRHAGAAAVRACIERVGQLAAVEWPDPEPLRESIAARPYPLNALPPIVLGAVKEVAEFSQAPVCLVAASALGVASIACQGLADVRRDGKLIGPASLYMLVIAESGERKTTCDGYFSSALRDWCAEQFEKHKPLLQEHEAKLGAWESQRVGVKDGIKLKSRKNEATSDLEKKLEGIEKEKPERPRVPRLVYGDATPEALAYGLAHDWPSAGLVSNEAGSVFGGHAMQRDSIMRSLALLNTLWDGGTHTVARRTSDSFAVSGARLSVSLMAQLPTLRSFVERGGGLIRGTGFLARFLIAWPETAIGTRTHKEAPASWPGLEKFHERVIALLSQPLTMEHGALRLGALTLSSEAFKKWRDLHNDTERDMASNGQFADVRDIGSKTAENAARLAAVFHLMEHGTVKSEIDAECMQSAARIAVWHLVEAKRLLGELDASPELSAAERLDTWLVSECQRRKATAIPTRDVLRDGPLATRSQQAMLAALDQLTSAGRARLLKDGKRRLIEVNPALLEGAA
jgi:putative DNA primase/helicase